MQTVLQDLRYGVRLLLKHKGFTLVAVLTLALGIGAGTAIFSMVKSVLIEPLPFAQPERLLQAHLFSQSTGEEDDWVSSRDVVDWQAGSQSFEGVGIYRFATLDLAGDGPPEASYGVRLSHELLPMLGVQPALGRFFLPEEDRPGGHQAIILSDALWRRRFAARRDIIGQTMRTSGGDYVVVGVMPPGFNFPLRLATNLRVPSRQMGFWMAWGDELGQGGRSSTNCIAILQLKTGVALEQAQAELDAVTGQLAHDYPQTNAGRGARLVSLKEQTVGQARPALLVLLGAIGLVVLIVCANICSLLLVRADGRRQEMAVRQALGATRFRLVRQAIVESLLLAFLGGTLGAALAAWSLKLLISFSPHNIPRLAEARMDGWTLMFALAITLAAGVLFGALPAWRTARVDLNESLKGAAAGVSLRRRSLFAAGNLLVSFEMALALALTLGAGLLLNSFVRLLRVDPGFQAPGVWAAIIILPRTEYPDAASNQAFFRRVVENLEASPGIEAAAISNSLPVSGHGNGAYLKVEGRPLVTENDPATLSALHIVSANYLRTMGIPLLRGRGLTAHDSANAAAVALINEAAAARFWPGEDPIGKRLNFGSSEWHQVIGVVKNTYRKQLDEAPEPEVYVSVDQVPTPTNFLAVRSALPPSSTAEALRRAVAAVDAQQPIFLTMSMESLIADALAKQRFSAWLFSAFSALALVLAALGIYGVVAYAVAQRTREIGIRIAIGAPSGQVLRLVLTQGLKPVAIGSLIGLFITAASSRVLSGLLYGVTATDPATFIGVVSLLLCVAVVACWIPARRATKIDPLVALRHE